MSLEQYYTEAKIGERLVSLLPELCPSTCVELSAGEGALLLPVLKKWPHISITTCELDSNNHAKITQNFDGDHYNIDVISPSFEDVVASYSEKHDLAVSNPPFSWRKNSEYEKEIFSAFDIDFMKKWKRVRSEIVFILQNLRLLKPFGLMAIILPELIVYSDLFRGFRKCLLKFCSIHAIAEIEERAFKGTDAKTYILVLQKKPSKNFFKFYHCNGSESVYSQEKFVSINENINIEDFKCSNGFPDLNIKRGRQSGKELKKEGRPYYHTSGFSKLYECDELYSRSGLKVNGKSTVIARRGDVLIHRVGSRAIGKIAVVEEGSFLVSDCVFKVSFSSHLSPCEILSYWKENELEIVSMARGTCAKYLTKEDIVFHLNKIIEAKLLDVKEKFASA